MTQRIGVRPRCPIPQENLLRTSVQRNRRKTIYRVLSVAFVLIGFANGFLGISHGDAFMRVMNFSLLWLVFGATWVALSRIWGELAEISAASKLETDSTPAEHNS